MNYSMKLLTKLKAMNDGCSDYRAAQILEISQQSISKVKNNGTSLSDETLTRLANLVGENPVIVVAENALEMNYFPNMRQFWEEVLANAKELESRASAEESEERAA
ncbi:hypothetical protein [Aliamphritea ceti]|uniref:hypothetical protein n=1 Tax=Aliamphritea ceti TaxID=1524258 RepID=UPI0021C3B729|nr:hypothetical protein [Aliamphritea ceti]